MFLFYPKILKTSEKNHFQKNRNCAPVEALWGGGLTPAKRFLCSMKKGKSKMWTNAKQNLLLVFENRRKDEHLTGKTLSQLEKLPNKHQHSLQRFEI